MDRIRTWVGLMGWILLVHLGCGACSALAVAEPWHPYHVSRAEVAWNPKSGNFEVALCVWPADLEQALARQADRPVDLQQEKQLSELAQQYLSTRFLIRPRQAAVADNQIRPAPAAEAEAGASGPKPAIEEAPAGHAIRWVGQEVGLKQAWLYFEISGDPQVADWTLENRAFFELNDDQLNHVQWSLGKQYETFVCQPDQPRQPCSTSRILRTRDGSRQ